LMEYFASDPRVLMSIGRHYKSGDPIPTEALEKFCAAKRIFSGVDIQSQLFYSILDQKYHGKHPLEGSTTEILSRVRNLVLLKKLQLFSCIIDQRIVLNLTVSNCSISNIREACFSRL